LDVLAESGGGAREVLDWGGTVEEGLAWDVGERQGELTIFEVVV
jgi:hypothetical protein